MRDVDNPARQPFPNGLPVYDELWHPTSVSVVHGARWKALGH